MSFWGWVSKLLNTYWPMFIKGTYVTFILAVVGTAAGFALGLLIGVVRAVPLRRGGETGLMPRAALLKAVNVFLVAYIEIFRGTPTPIKANSRRNPPLCFRMLPAQASQLWTDLISRKLCRP